jgi:hypothetical protein
MKYKIDKSIPIPHFGAKKFPFGTMEVGQSFREDPEPHESFKETQSRILNAARRFCKSNKRDWGFLSRKEGDHIRCWRYK